MFVNKILKKLFNNKQKLERQERAVCWLEPTKSSVGNIIGQ